MKKLLVFVGALAFVFASCGDKKKEEAKPAAPPAPSKDEVLLTEIRDLLKNK